MSRIDRFMAPLVALGILALAGGCTQGSSQIEAAGPMPRPQVVVVQNLRGAPRARCSSTPASAA